MPFRSEAQRRLLWAKKPDIASRWAHEHPGQKNLPEHVKKAMMSGFVEEFTKISTENPNKKYREFAPGIPLDKKLHPIRKVTTETEDFWPFVVQEHHAARAGKHFDVRLGDPQTGYGHSWATRELPKPGKSTYAVQQPTHTIPYFDFAGELKTGYGKGMVYRHRREDAEVVEATNNKINFNLYPGKDTEEYTLVRLKDKGWLLMNRTPTKETHPQVPTSKQDYKDIKPDQINMEDKSHLMQAKIDGAHLSYHLTPGKQIKAFSHRPTERETGIIQHTYRIPKLVGQRAPKELGDTILRGEVYARKHSSGKAIPAKDLGGLLNSGVFLSRTKQKQQAVEMANAVFDVERFRGEDYSKKPYRERLEALKEVRKLLPKIFELPAEAHGPSEKEKLLEKIKAGRHPETKEGVVLWNLDEPKTPIKAKIKPVYDVVIRDVFPAGGGMKGKMAGGFTYSMKPTSDVVGKVGTGFSHALRKKMWENPKAYRGLYAKVQAQEQFPSGALRAPALKTIGADEAGSVPENSPMK